MEEAQCKASVRPKRIKTTLCGCWAFVFALGIDFVALCEELLPRTNESFDSPLVYGFLDRSLT